MGIIKKTLGFYKTLMKDFIFYKYKNSYIHFNDIFYVNKINQESVTVTGGKEFYALTLSSTEDIPYYLNNINSLVNEFMYDKEAQLYIFFTKNKIINKDAKVVNNYIFSKNKKLLMRINNLIKSRFLNGQEIVQAIFNITDYNTYSVNENTYKVEPLINYSFSNQELDMAGFNFKKIFVEAVYKNAINYKLFQLTGITKSFDDFNIDKLLKNDFNGYIHIYLNFSYFAVKSKINFLYNEIQKFEKNKEIKDKFVKFKKMINEKDFTETFAVANLSALIDNKNAFNTVKDISNALNSNVIEKSVFKKDILYRTPLLERDIDFDFFTVSDNFKKIITTFSKENNFNTKNPINITGKNLIGNYVTFSFSESNPPHSIIFAKSRSGKSFFLQKIIAETIRYNAKNNTADMLEDNNIRYFDKGLSAIKFVSNLQENYPDKIKSITSFKNLYFNFFDLETNELGKIDETDLIFSLSVMNIFLELNDMKIINAEEEFHLKEAVNSIFFKKSYEGIPLDVLHKIEGFKEIVDKIYQKYPSYQYKNIMTKDITDKEFAFLNKPRISDVIKYLELKERNSFIPEIQKKIIKELLKKLNIINSVDKFQYYSLFNVKEANFFYLDIDEIEKLGEKIFVPVFWFLFYKFYKMDLTNAIKSRIKKGQRGKPSFYVIEEAHNYMRYSSLENFFDALSREAAKYNIHLIFVTQFISDLPEKVIGNIGNKIILPALAENSIEQIKELEKIWNRKKEYLEFFIENKIPYMAFIEYDGGLFTLKPTITKEELCLFNSES